MEIRDKLDDLLDQLEAELPAILQKYPDADQGDFWFYFAEREIAIETVAGADHAAYARLQLDRMLFSHNIIRTKVVPAAGNEHADQKAQSVPNRSPPVPNTPS